MNNKQRMALELSIDHWQELFDLAADQQLVLYSQIIGPACPCCQEFFSYKGCGECPIAAYTGEPDCEATPWMAVYGTVDTSINPSYAFAKLVEAELNFLKEVLNERP